MGYMKDIAIRIENGEALSANEAKVAKAAGYEVENINGEFYVKEKE